jgi:hypothetical protein
MKKLVFTLLIMAFAFSAMAQVDKQLTTITDSAAIAADTTVFGPFSYNYEWALWIETWSLDDVDAVVKIQAAPDTTGIAGWYDYSGADSVVLDAATGLWMFEKTNMVPRYFRQITILNSVTSGGIRTRVQTVKK